MKNVLTPVVDMIWEAEENINSFGTMEIACMYQNCNWTPEPPTCGCGCNC